jgi:hypothetical protein
MGDAGESVSFGQFRLVLGWKAILDLDDDCAPVADEVVVVMV